MGLVLLPVSFGECLAIGRRLVRFFLNCGKCRGCFLCTLEFGGVSLIDRFLVGLGFGQLRLERLWLEVYDYNARARRSYEKCGFTLEGTERHAIYKHGRHHDVHMMSILSEEWAAQPRRKSWEYGPR